MIQEEEKYPEIREKLRNLPRFKASADFTAKLQSRINELEASETIYQNQNTGRRERSNGFFQSLFGKRGNSWLIPASGFAVVLIIAAIFYFSPGDESPQITSVQQENPDLTQQNTTDESSTNNLKEMKRETVADENLADNNLDKITEDPSPSAPDQPSSERNTAVEQESRIRPEVKIDTEDTALKTQETEERIREEFKTSATENMGARSKNENSLTAKNEDTNRLSRSRRSPTQVSTIKQIDLESLREKVSE